MSNCWETLGLPERAGAEEIRRAYASLIRVHRPDGDPQAFSAIREAYEEAMAWTRYQAQWAEEDGREDEAGAERALEGSGAGQADSTAAEPSPEVRALQPLAESPSPAESAPASTAGEARKRADRIVNAGAAEGRALLQATSRWIALQDIDAQLDYEAALIGGFATHPAPDFAVLLDVAIAHRWEERFDDTVQIAGYYGAEELRKRIELARQTVFAMYFSSNAWLRRLLSPRGPGAAWVGLRSGMDAAEAFATHWQSLREGSTMDESAIRIRADVLRRMRVTAIPSTDILLALLVALIGWANYIDGPKAVMVPVLGFTAVIGACALHRRLLGFARYAKVWRWVMGSFFAALGTGFGGAVALVVGSAISKRPDTALHLWGGNALIAAGAFVLIILWGRFLWNLLLGLERVVLIPWNFSRQASDGYLFSQALEGRRPLDQRPPLAPRLQQMPRAWRFSVRRNSERKRAEAGQKAERERMGIKEPSFLRKYWMQLIVVLAILAVQLEKLFR
ncbi:MAG: hypothetical protein ABW051_03595 [Burkholderiaceae bacterium]